MGFMGFMADSSWFIADMDWITILNHRGTKGIERHREVLSNSSFTVHG
jgi:hypothetical protein